MRAGAESGPFYFFKVGTTWLRYVKHEYNSRGWATKTILSDPTATGLQGSPKTQDIPEFRRAGSMPHGPWPRCNQRQQAAMRGN